MRLIRLREYEWLGTSEKSSCSERISEAETDLLLDLEAGWTRGVLDWDRDKVRFAGFCGFVRLGQVSIEILPKIAENGFPSADRRVLLRMLRIAYDLPLLVGGEAQASLQSECFFDVLVRLYCDTLRESARRGLVHVYESDADNLRRLRGKLDIPTQLRRNACHPERLFCRFEEFREDNVVNRTLKAALRAAERHARSPGSRTSILSLLELFQDVTDVKDRKIPWSSFESDRRLSGWRRALIQARWFLDGESPHIGSGGSDSIAILFDMAALFERFISSEIRSLLNPEGYSIITQGPHRSLLFKDGTSGYRLCPDIHISRENKPLCILDAKWKNPGTSDGSFDMGQADLYQVYAYAKAFDVQSVGLMYPARLYSPARKELWTYMDGRVKLFAMTIDLQSLLVSLSEFREQLLSSGIMEAVAG